MELSYTDEEIAFRDEVRAFFAEAVPSETRRKLLEERRLSKEEIVDWQKTLNAKGWAVVNWPVAYGGQPWSPILKYLYFEELQLAPAPQPQSFNVNMLGPVLCAFGSETQKRRFLPRIANLDDWWCQGFSEPNAGSDLAALQTTAKRTGNVYVVNGQKTWTTNAQYSDWIFCLVRTNREVKKQAGISFLLIDMRSKGITVRPIQTIDGGYEINEVFFDDVEVPVENLVGEENRGWDYAKFLLSHERFGQARIGVSKERLRRVRDVARNVESGGQPLIEDRAFRERLVAVEVELKALEINQLRALAAHCGDGRDGPDPASSILKIRGSELQQATTELLLEAAGPFAAPYDSGGLDGANAARDWTAQIASSYFNNRKVSIYGGSNEIQRSIIAKAILGL